MSLARVYDQVYTARPELNCSLLSDHMAIGETGDTGPPGLLDQCYFFLYVWPQKNKKKLSIGPFAPADQ